MSINDEDTERRAGGRAQAEALRQEQAKQMRGTEKGLCGMEGVRGRVDSEVKEAYRGQIRSCRAWKFSVKSLNCILIVIKIIEGLL